ncbi:MAG: VWA domain-containing protein [Sumerlaeia bacterium]
MDIRFADPLYLFLLFLLPVIWYASVRLRTAGKVRRWVIIGLRTLIITLLVLALAQLEITRNSKDLTVYFLIDQSESIPADVRNNSAEIINDILKKKRPNDEVGIIVFGGNPSIETMAVSKIEDLTGSYNSMVDTSLTDVSAALRLALSAFPNDTMNRVVLLSDGNENKGSALETARLASNSNVAIDVVPLRYVNQFDVRIDKVVVPQRTQKDQPFEIKVFPSMSSPEGEASSGPRSVTGTMRIFEDDKLIAEEVITVDEGKNAPLVLPRRLTEGGFHRYRATFEAPGDTRIQNNEAQGFTNLIDKPRVLYVEGDQNLPLNYLAGALQLEDINVTLIAPQEIPISIEELQSFDSLILSNVHAGDMSRAQMKMIERGVHDLGLGLIMIGGEDAFGAGGYQDSPIEAALPVSLDIKQKKVLPNGALVILLHTVEIPQGNAWAREISLASLDVLSAQDYFGLLYYGTPQNAGATPGGNTGGWGGFTEEWLWKPGLQQTGDKRAMRQKIFGVQPMDIQAFDPMLQMAYEGLRDVKTQAKHIIVISDGDPAAPNKQLVQNIRDEGITVSAVGIAPHHPNDLQNLELMSNWGSGEFYHPKTSSELPRIFVKEASVVRRSLIFEEDFSPVRDAYSETMDGITALPILGGYVVTSDKELATIALRTDKDDPLLAHWRYGLGKTVAFTSDAKNKWASQWVDWQGYSKFWSQVVRWSMREASSSNVQVATEIRDGRGKVIVDALDADGDFENFLEFDTTVLGPDLEPQQVRVRQVGPGRYEGDFEANEVGTYMVRLNSGDAETPSTVVTGAALSYSPEHETNRSNEDFMNKLAQESRGIVAQADYNAFRPTLLNTRRPTPLWEWLLFTGLILVPLDVFVRRVYVDWADIKNSLLRAVSLKPKRTREQVQADEARGSLLATKSRVREKAAGKEESTKQRSEFRDRLAKQAEANPEGDSVFKAAEDAANKKPVVRSSKQTVGDGDGSGGAKPSGSLSDLKKAKERAKKKM